MLRKAQQFKTFQQLEVSILIKICPKEQLILNENIEITVLMPCLNEEETLAACIQEAQAAIVKTGLAGEVLIADNGSNDSSVQIAEQTGACVTHVSEKGYGNTLMGGIKQARGTYILMGDADQSYNFGDLPKFFERLQQGADLVMGCRFPKGGGYIEPGAMPWKHRWIGNPVLSTLGKLFFSSPINDFHCGLRAFRKQAILDLDLCTKGMEFASEMVIKATLNNLKIEQVGTVLRQDGRSRAPHLRSWRDGWRHLRFMLLYSPNWLFILPGFLLMLTGIIGFGLLWSEPLAVKGVTFDLGSLIVANTAILLGMQILCFGILIKVYAINSGLWPESPHWLQFARGRPVEWGVVSGLLLFIAGLASLVYSVLIWQDAGFSALDYQASLRIIIPAVTLMTLGFQITFSGFAIAILGIER